MNVIETVDTADREIVLSRVLDAPRELVFQAYTDQRHLAKWWGPRGFTTTTHEVDIREGGVWRFTMHGPDGTDYPNRIRYREITPPERLFFLLDADDDADAPFEVTVTFADRGGKTELTQRMVLPTAEERERVVGFGAVELGHQTLEKLAEHLTTLSGASTELAWEPAGDGRDLVIRRVLAAPRETVFRAWTDPERFARWFGPRGTTLPRCEIDARPGGALHFCHRHAEGGDVWVRGVYQEVVAPEKIVFTVGFSDESGAEVERPGFPREMRLVVTLAEAPAGTELTIRQSGLERDQGEVEGWVETIDRLVELVA